MTRQARRNHLTAALSALPLLALFLLAGRGAQAAADCPKQNDNGSIMCTDINFWCGGTCQPQPDCPNGPGDPYGVKPARNCGSCLCACPSDKPNDCTSTNQECQSTNSGCAVVFRQSVCNTAGGATAQMCGSCLSGYLDCSGTCQPTTDPSCPAPGVWDACAKKCVEKYVLSNPTVAQAPQTSSIQLSGDSKLLNGDAYFTSTKAMRVDGAGVTTFNVGNWGTGATGFKLDLFGELCLENGASCRSDWPLGLPTLADPNSTLRYDGANWVASTRMVNDDSNIGIGYTSPKYSLDVRSAVGAAVVNVNDRKSAAGEPQLWTGYRVSRGPGTDGSGTEKWFLGVNAADDKFRVQRNGTTSDLVIDTSGKVGIGTASPLYRFEVAAANDDVPVFATRESAIGVWIEMGRRNITQRGADFSINAQEGALNLRTAGNDRLTIMNASGNVGIGTTNPEKNLDIRGVAGGVIARLNDNIGGGSRLWTGLSLARSLSEKWFVGMDDATDKLLFRRVGATDDMVIDAAGKVGIGTASPAQSLDVNGTAQMTGFKMPTGAQDKYVLMSDATGVGSWQNLVGLPETANEADTLRYNGTTSKWVASHLLSNTASNIGIGVTAPDAAGWPLDVRAATGSAMVSVNDRSGTLWTGLRLARTDGGDLNRERWFIGMPGNPDAGNQLVFKEKNNAGTDVIRMTVNYDTGNVGIGTDTPGQKLEVNGVTQTAGFVLPPGSGVAKDYVLTSRDDTGYGEWRKIIAADECTGGKFNHLTGSPYDGNQGGYPTVNGYCGAGQHICTPDEILRTIVCAPATLDAPFWPIGTSAWVANGPPGFTSPAANDCSGWTSNAASSYGAFWQLTAAGTGKGLATSCSLSLKVACCQQ